MKISNFYHIPVKGDGSCFFHSISGINHLNEHLWPLLNSKPITYRIESKQWNTSSSKLRNKCVDWLEDNLNYRINGLDTTIREEILEDVRTNDNIIDKSVKGYLKYMRKDQAYAGQIEIYAISELLNKNIRTYISKDGKLSNVGLGYEIKPKDNAFDIFLYHNLGDIGNYQGGHHFEILYPKNKAKILSKTDYMKKVHTSIQKKKKRSVNQKKRSVNQKKRSVNQKKRSVNQKKRSVNQKKRRTIRRKK